MRRSTNNKLKMYQSVYSVMITYQSNWQGIPAMVSAVNNFESKLNLLQLRHMQQLTVTSGVAETKKLRTADLQKRILIVQSALFLFGRDTGNMALKERSRVSRSSLQRMNLGVFAAHCAFLKNDLELFGTQLATYNVSTESVIELNSLLSGVVELNNSIHMAVIERKSATQSIYDLERAIDALLKIDLDTLIRSFESSNPEFFERFQLARIVMHLGNGGPGTRPEEPDDGSLSNV